tara:strand:- start:192 stop:413 length:222 start_codon:yes stop_codon:yes gene_type:complete
MGDKEVDKDTAMEDTYEDLALYLITKISEDASGTRQIWVCIAGGPGSGKSTLGKSRDIRGYYSILVVSYGVVH